MSAVGAVASTVLLGTVGESSCGQGLPGMMPADFAARSMAPVRTETNTIGHINKH